MTIVPAPLSPTSFAPLVWIVLFAVGCGSHEIPLYPVEGRVTFKGAPVADATVALHGDASTRLPTGRTDADGKFRISTLKEGDGAPVGKYVVTVSKFSVDVPDSPQPTSMDQAAKAPPKTVNAKSELPRPYGDPAQSRLECEVSAKPVNELSLDLRP